MVPEIKPAIIKQQKGRFFKRFWLNVARAVPQEPHLHSGLWQVDL